MVAALALPLATAVTASAVEGEADEAATTEVAPETIEVRYTGEREVATDAELALAVEVTGAEAFATLELAVAPFAGTNPIEATLTEVDADVDGAASAAVAAGTLLPGEYVIGLVQDGVVVRTQDSDAPDVVVVPAEDAGEEQPAAEEPASSEDPTTSEDPTAPEDPATPEDRTTSQQDADRRPDQQAAALPDPSVDTPQEQAALYSDYARELFDPDGDGVFEVPTPARGSNGAGAIPAGLEAYYTQDVDLSIDNCEAMGQEELAFVGYVECGYVIVPMDAEDPAAGNLALGVARGLATGSAQGSMLLNPGGPGGDGMWMATMGDAFPELADSFDFIGFDPRGVGSSVPFARCIDDADRDELFGRSNYGRTQEEIEALYYDDAKAYADDCFANTGAVLGLSSTEKVDLVSHLGTWDAVGDVDIIRSVLGDPQLNYLGYSYGTQLGYVYAQKFPDNVGRMVLDAAVDPMPGEQVVVPQRLELSADEQATVDQIAGFQDAFEQFARDCSAKGEQLITWDEAYGLEDGYLPPSLIGAPYATYGEEMADQPFSCPLGNGVADVDALSAASAALIQSADEANGGTGYTTLDPDGRTLVAATARTGVIQSLYAQDYWGLLAYGLWELVDREEGTGLLAMADLYNGRFEDGSYGNADAAFTTIRCTDSNPSGTSFDVEAAREFAAAYDAAAPFQAGPVVVGSPDYCQFWRFTGTQPPGEYLTSVPNILVISTSHDSATPYASGVKLARVVDGTLLSVSGASHGASGSGIACVDSTVTDFMVDGVLPEEGPFGPRLGSPDTALMPDGSTIELTNRCRLDSYRPSGVEISRNLGRIGDVVEMTAQHLDSLADYTVTFDGVRVSSLSTDNGGNDANAFAVPAGVERGDHTVSVLDATGAEVARFPFRVLDGTVPGDGAGGQLPETGAADVLPLLLMAAALMSTGAAMVTIRSRRRLTSAQ